MANILIIGAGGVGRVVVHKCVQNRDIFENITLASRRLSSCEAYQSEVKERYGVDINIAEVDADDVPALVELIEKVKPDMV